MFRLRLKELRESVGLSQYAFAEKFGISQSTVGNWEAGRREPNSATMQRIADFFGVTVDYLLGRDEPKKEKPPVITEKDEKDIQKRIINVLDDLHAGDGLMYDGEPMDEETRELIALALEQGMRVAKIKAKKKYTPKKYRYED